MTKHSSAEMREFQGSQVANVPEQPGLYAWYYRPKTIRREQISSTLARFLMSEAKITTQIYHRYGVHIEGTTLGETRFGARRQSVEQTVAEAFDRAEPFLDWFFQSAQFVHFCRPIYIGIARDLYERVYNQHYVSLNEYWQDTSPLSRFLSSNQQATVQEAMARLDMPHSFALEARVRGILSRDLMVAVLATDHVPSAIGSDIDAAESETRRALERLLQLLSDPICGRR